MFKKGMIASALLRKKRICRSALRRQHRSFAIRSIVCIKQTGFILSDDYPHDSLQTVCVEERSVQGSGFLLQEAHHVA
jgi:hypothetical protein